MIMTELAAALPVDIMPGPDDPANVSLPQQPLHQCLFPGARERHSRQFGGCRVRVVLGKEEGDCTSGHSRAEPWTKGLLQAADMADSWRL
jgi:hypothetical protein